MSILVNRAASRLTSYFQPLFQTSRVSSRQFSVGPLPPLGNKLATSLATFSEVKPKYNFKNITSSTVNRSNLGYLAAAIVAAIATWFFSTIFKTAQALESISEVQTAAMTADDLAAIAQKHGELWECIGRTPDEFGGYIYHYKLRKEFDFETLRLVGYDRNIDENGVEHGDNEFDRKVDASDEKIEEIFPSVEPQGFNEVSNIIQLLSQGRFKKLGYSIKHDDTGVYLGLPDKEALEARYEKIRKIHPGLKPLNILSAEGIFDDISFIESYLKYDFILSEFVHDHISHALPTLNLMLSYPDEYHIERERLRGIIAKVLSLITKAEQMTEEDSLNDLKSQLPKIKTALGIAVDTLWAIPVIGLLESLNLENFEDRLTEFIEESQFRKFWKKKFGEKFDRDDFARFWRQLANLEKHHAEEPKIQAVDKQNINP